MNASSAASGRRILVVEDQEVNRELLVSYLQNEHYDVHQAEDGLQAEEMLSSNDFDIVLLDIMLPGIDGLTLTRQIRANSDMGVILVTNKTEDIDRIIGLELGADDYITKPFNSRELLARTKNLMRRVKTLKRYRQVDCQIKKVLNFGEWKFYISRRTLESKSETVRLSEGEFSLLSALINNSGNVMSRDQLLSKIKNREWCPTDRSIDVLIARLRRKLGDNSGNPTYISTAHGSGYIFVADIYFS